MNKRLLSLVMILLLSGVFTFFMATDTADASKTTIGKQLIQVRDQLLDNRAEYRRSPEDGSRLTILQETGKEISITGDLKKDEKGLILGKAE